MPNFRLHRDHKSTLRLASRDAMESLVAGRFARRVRQQNWVIKTNDYRLNTISKIRLHDRRGGIKSDALCDYIAASAPLHAMDGWAFLGRALDCLMHGDSETCRHLAYYAELRATMSILATEGIGIFSEKHFIVNHIATAHRVNRTPGERFSTHSFIWPCLEHWSNLQRCTRLLDRMININGVPMSDWIVALVAGAGRSDVSGEWLKKWGCDLRRVHDDHDSRNEASYRPTQIRGTPPLSTNEIVSFIRDFWTIFRPGGSGSFELIDRYLLRVGLERTLSPTPNALMWDDAIDRMMARIRIDDDQLTGFLKRRILPDDPLPIIEAYKDDGPQHPRHHLQVISRAALLLRIATGSTRLLFTAAGLATQDLRFWWSSFGVDRGICDNIGPIDPVDRWIDIENCLGDLALWIANPNSTTSSIYHWRTVPAHHLSIVELSCCELVGMWGLVA